MLLERLASGRHVLIIYVPIVTFRRLRAVLLRRHVFEHVRSDCDLSGRAEAEHPGVYSSFFLQIDRTTMSRQLVCPQISCVMSFIFSSGVCGFAFALSIGEFAHLVTAVETPGYARYSTRSYKDCIIIFSGAT